MKRQLIAILLVMMATMPASAGRIEDSIVAQLRAQGFTRIEVGRTLLGRSRIVAQSRQLNREIIVNPVTGEILRDYWTQRNGAAAPQIVNPNPSPEKENEENEDDDGYSENYGSGSGDDDDGDNSGHGSGDDDGDDSGDDGGNSGSGGGGSSGSGGGDDGGEDD